MTWPFENDTSAIVKKLADRSMKADKGGKGAQRGGNHKAPQPVRPQNRV